MTAIKLENVSYEISTSYGRKFILRNINLVVSEGELHVIKGPSGAGKSTLLQLCGSLLFPTKGTVEVFGIQSSPKNSATIRSNIGFMFQSPVLIDHLTVRENIRLLGEWRGVDAREAESRGMELLDRFGLRDFWNQLPLNMSMGQRQRVSLVLSMIPTPNILFLDEPLGSVDHDSREVIKDHLMSVYQKEELTMLIVTHDSTFDQLATVVHHLKDGYLIN